MADFEGFPQQAVQFFAEIAENNNRDWFEEHKEEYIRYVQQPAQDFVMVLGAKLKVIAPGISFEPSLSGTGSIMRIYRDIRFSKDKSPHKTYLGLRFWEGPGRKQAYSSLFIWLDKSGAGIHLGQHMFSKEFLLAYRNAVADPQTGAELEEALEAIRPHAEIGGDRYNRVPRGFPKEHPRAELLKYKALYASSGHISPEVVTSPDFLPGCAGSFEALLPLHNWLVQVGRMGG